MSKIEWTGVTWNPYVGCTEVSPECDNCYAKYMVSRFRNTRPHYNKVVQAGEDGVSWTGSIGEAPRHIFEMPLRLRKPTTIFVNSLSDLFHEQIPDEGISRVFDIMNSCPHLTFQILTKRPNRVLRMSPRLNWAPNIWLGVSVGINKMVTRARLLAKVPAAVRFISAEPLIEALPDLDLDGIDWLICGGESGRSADVVRPMHIDWARDLRDRCRSSSVAFFFKQWGNWDLCGKWCRSKSEAGRHLDGEIWEQMPIPQERRSATWGTVSRFRAELLSEHQAEEAPPVHRGTSPRVSLREAIWHTLRQRGALETPMLRYDVLTREGLDPTSTRMVNYHAWALVDLQQMGWVRKFYAHVPGRRGRLRKITMYMATKPRVRVRAIGERR